MVSSINLSSKWTLDFFVYRIRDLRTVVSLLNDSEPSKGLKRDTTVFVIMSGLICVLLRVQFCNFVKFKYY